MASFGYHVRLPRQKNLDLTSLASGQTRAGDVNMEIQDAVIDAKKLQHPLRRDPHQAPNYAERRVSNDASDC